MYLNNRQLCVDNRHCFREKDRSPGPPQFPRLTHAYYDIEIPP